LIHEPFLVLCDEPTAALDADTGHAVMDLLAGIALRPDRAVIIVTHDNRILEFADRIAFMDDGHITRIETRAGLEAPQLVNRHRTRPFISEVSTAGGSV
jgi:putative ABC transport system ATP-binding protein